MSALRIKNYIKQIGGDEERMEQFVARCTNSQDPQKLVDVLDKIGHIDVKLFKLLVLYFRQARVNSSIARIFEFSASFISSNASGPRDCSYKALTVKGIVSTRRETRLERVPVTIVVTTPVLCSYPTGDSYI